MGNPVVLVYSNSADMRAEIIGAVGRRPAPDVGRVDFLECEGVAEVLLAIDSHAVDVMVLDGEAQPTGGIGISRQIHMETDDIPPVILAVRRAADRWLATWAKADDVIVMPLDPVTTADAVAAALRKRSAAAAKV